MWRAIGARLLVRCIGRLGVLLHRESSSSAFSGIISSSSIASSRIVSSSIISIPGLVWVPWLVVGVAVVSILIVSC